MQVNIVSYSVAGCGMIGVKPTEVVELLSLSNRPFTAANDGTFLLSQEENLGKFLCVANRLKHYVIYSVVALPLISICARAFPVLYSQVKSLRGHVSHLLGQAFGSLGYELLAYCNHVEIYNSYQPHLNPYSHSSGKAQE